MAASSSPSQRDNESATSMKQREETTFDSLFEKVGKPGLYQWILLVTIWLCNITAIVNILFMVFGEITDTCLIENATSSCSDFYSMVPHFNLTGRLDYVPALFGSVQLGGALVGALFAGQFADIFGRRTCVLAFVTGSLLFGVASAFVPNWQTMLLFRFAIGVFSGGYESAGVIYAIEIVNPKHRLPFEASVDTINSIGFAWLALLAWLLRDWRILTVVGNVQVLPAIGVLLWCEESPRWLWQKRRFADALKAMKKIARLNKVELKLDVCDIERFEVENASMPQKCDPCEFLRLLSKLFRSAKMLKYTFMMMFNFLVAGIVGYGLIFNVPNLVGSIYVNLALLGLLNVIPAIAVIAANRYFAVGRRKVHQIALNGVWISLLIVAIVLLVKRDGELHQLVVATSLIGSMFSFPLWVVSNLYSAELFPTLVRNVANGLGGMSAKVGGIIAPVVVVYLIKFWPPLPFIFMTAMTLVNAVLAFFLLPETQGKALPDHF